jgi:hypothetical protein
MRPCPSGIRDEASDRWHVVVPCFHPEVCIIKPSHAPGSPLGGAGARNDEINAATTKRIERCLGGEGRMGGIVSIPLHSGGAREAGHKTTQDADGPEIPHIKVATQAYPATTPGVYVFANDAGDRAKSDAPTTIGSLAPPRCCSVARDGNLRADARRGIGHSCSSIGESFRAKSVPGPIGAASRDAV